MHFLFFFFPSSIPPRTTVGRVMADSLLFLFFSFFPVLNQLPKVRAGQF